MNDEEIRKLIGEKIKKHRKEMNLSQNQLSEKVGVGPLSILKYEKGERDIPFSLLVKICSVLEIPLKDFNIFFKNSEFYYNDFILDVLSSSNKNNFFEKENYNDVLSFLEFLEKINFNINLKKTSEIFELRLEYQNFLYEFKDFHSFSTFLNFFTTSNKENILNYLKTHTDVFEVPDFSEEKFEKFLMEVEKRKKEK